MTLVLAIILVALLVGAWPGFGFHPYGYYPGGVIGVLLLVLLVLLLLGRL